MDIKEIAKLLDGRQYHKELTDAEEKRFKELGVVIVFGYSDDNMELRGAIHDEAGCYDGGDVYITAEGVFEECECECKYSQTAKAKAHKIHAIWGEGGYSWIYKNQLPHECFDVLEDDSKYCRGIVFLLAE